MEELGYTEQPGRLRRLGQALGRVAGIREPDDLYMERKLEERLEKYGPRGFILVPTAESMTIPMRPESGPYPLPG